MPERNAPDYAARPDGACQRVRDLHNDHVGFWQPYWDAMTNEEAFLDGDRYADDQGSYQRDRRRNQIRGLEVNDTIDHIVAKSTERPLNIVPRPQDSETDAVMGEFAVVLCERELRDPWKGFEDRLDEAITACRERRLGIVWMDWDPDCGPFGEILYRFLDGRRVMWDEAYDPHHPKCAWLKEEKRIPVEEARRIYKAPYLMPDRDAFQGIDGYRPGLPTVMNGAGERLPSRSQVHNDNKVTLWLTWFKNDKTPKQKSDEADYRELEPGQRYMVCKNKCGYRTPTQQELQNQDKIEEELPEFMPAACTTCEAQGSVGDLERIDAVATDAVLRTYERGRRLIVMAPFSPGPDDEPLYDDRWPIPQARSFPGLFLTARVRPGRPMGPADTTRLWDQQVACDSLRTMGVQRAFEHRTYWELPRAGIVDGKNRRFAFMENQYNLMYRDNNVGRYGPLDVKMHQGAGLDPMWPTVFQITHQALTQYRGVTDLGFTEESSKDIAASTLSQMNQMAETQTAHFNRRKSREIGKFTGVLWDYIRATYTPERLKRMNIEGLSEATALSGDDLPNYDFVLEDNPPFTGMERAQMQAFQKLVEVAQAMPQFLDIFAEAANMPPSIVKKIQDRVEDLKKQQEEDLADQGERELADMERARGTGGRPERGGPARPPAAPPAAGPNGAGMEPAPVA